MRSGEKLAWPQFVYNLLYPAILGSMLYDVLKEAFYLEAFGVAKLLVIAFYCLDYLHLHSHLKTNMPESTTIPRMLIDSAIAVLIGVAYWQVSFEGFDRSMYCLLAVSILILAYPLPRYLRTWPYYGSNTVLLLLVFGMFLFVKLHGITSSWCMPFVYGTPMAWYAFHVFWISRRIGQRTANN